MDSTNELIKEIWSLWESMAECGELSIGPKFSQQYKELKALIEQKLNKHGISGKRPTVEDFFRQSYPESTKWDKFDFELIRFDALSLMDFAERYASQAACASGAQATVAERGVKYCEWCQLETPIKDNKCSQCGKPCAEVL